MAKKTTKRKSTAAKSIAPSARVGVNKSSQRKVAKAGKAGAGKASAKAARSKAPGKAPNAKLAKASSAKASRAKASPAKAAGVTSRAGSKAALTKAALTKAALTKASLAKASRTKAARANAGALPHHATHDEHASSPSTQAPQPRPIAPLSLRDAHPNHEPNRTDSADDGLDSRAARGNDDATDADIEPDGRSVRPFGGSAPEAGTPHVVARSFAKREGPPPSVEEFAIEVARLLRDDKCEDVQLLDVRRLRDDVDFIAIASGTSDRQMRSVLRHTQELGASCGWPSVRSNADERATWLLADFVGVVVHLFEPATRAHYDLEMLWGDAPRIAWERPDQAQRDLAGLAPRGKH